MTALFYLFLPVLIILPLLLFVGVAVFLIFRTAAKATLSVGECARCRYDLTMLSGGNCPECGHPYYIDEQGRRIS